MRHYSRLDHLPSCDIEDLKEVEYKHFKKCDLLTDALKEALLGDLKDKSAASQYDRDQVYDVGDIIIYHGYYLEATELNPGDPDCNGKWKPCDKFETQCYNELWCNGLARYLSLHTIIYSVENVGIQVNGNGFVKPRGSDFQSISREEKIDWVTDKYKKASIAFQMMEDYMSTSECFIDLCPDLYGYSGCGCKKKNCDCGKQRKRKFKIL